MNFRKSLDAFGMYNGSVLTPELARALSEQQKAKQLPLTGYGLVGWISPKMHAQIEAHPDAIGWRLTAFETQLKQMLLIVTVQAGQFQGRLLMHLADPNVQEMLKWCAHNGHMQLVLGVPEQVKVVRYNPPFYQEDLGPLLALAAESRHLPMVHTLVEFAESAIELMQQKDKLVCSGMGTVEEVTVTSILWQNLLQEAEVEEEVQPETMH